MPFCPICKRNHDPASNCFDGTDQVLRNMGHSKKLTRKSAEELKKVVNQADRLAFKILLLIVALFVLMIVLTAVLKK